MKILKCNNLDKVSVNFITIIIIFASISIIFFTMPVRACHEVGTYESDYVTPKTTFLQGEIVYGKGTDIVPGHFKLRIRDPSNNIVNYSDPVYGKKVTCSWDLDDDAPIGEWNIQLGQYYKGSWHWSWTANFYVIAMSKYTLTININSDGIVTRDPDQETYNYGTLVNLTSYDNLGWSFSHWSGDLNGTENPTTINMTSNKTVTAHFTEDRYTLTINIKGSGTVNKDPFQQNYTYGTLVNLTANANPGWTFDHWGGDLNGSQNPENITMDDHKTVIAYFSENKGDGGEEQEEEEEGDHTDDSKTDKSSSGSYYSNQLPVSNASGPYSGAIGEEIEFDGSGSFDLDGTITHYGWSFGDGTTGNGEKVTHNYSEGGSFLVTLTVTDDKGATDTNETTAFISVPNRPPSIPEISGFTNGSKGIDYTFTVFSTDDDNDSIKYIFDWGDGKVYESGFLPSGIISSGAHRWTSAGSYTVKVTAIDGQASSSSELTIIIKEPVEENLALLILALSALILLILSLMFIKRKK